MVTETVQKVNGHTNETKGRVAEVFLCSTLSFCARGMICVKKKPIFGDKGNSKASPILKNRAYVENFSIICRYAVIFSDTRV